MATLFNLDSLDCKVRLPSASSQGQFHAYETGVYNAFRCSKANTLPDGLILVYLPCLVGPRQVFPTLLAWTAFCKTRGFKITVESISEWRSRSAQSRCSSRDELLVTRSDIRSNVYSIGTGSRSSIALFSGFRKPFGELFGIWLGLCLLAGCSRVSKQLFHHRAPQICSGSPCGFDSSSPLSYRPRCSCNHSVT